jgi:hypothetical protein
MKRVAMSVAFAAIVSMGSHVLADEASSSSASSADNNSGKAETLQQCMARQKATNSSSMSKQAMQTVCKNEMKQNKEHKQGNDLASGPQADKSQSH